MSFSRGETWAFRVYSTGFFLLLSIDCLNEARTPLWTTPTKIAVTKLPSLFEDTLRWVPEGEDIQSAYYACVLCCLATAVSPHFLYPFVAMSVTVLYNFAYFATSLNLFQHKYMISMILWIIPFAAHSTRANRLLRTYTGLVYGFTAVTKVLDNGIFASGMLLPSLVLTKDNHDMMNWIADTLLQDVMNLWAFLSIATIVCEILLCIFLIRGTHSTLAIFLGISMHVGIHFSSVFRIGFFTYYMLSFYVLLIPSAYAEWVKS